MAFLSVICMSYRSCFFLFMLALLPISPAESISSIKVHSSSIVQLTLRDLFISLVELFTLKQQFIQMGGQHL